ncbi:nucleoid-associated protein [Listeria booriae]|uniref:nucleoid-associated protein n=1 Tax=Listeria booriae TaxID=1552123 RepID=UPI001625D91A|nr:nucleoid-associated protein [Listeria booriae]MBC2368112.1 nucleoid-associated protein [Listeria booriae]
MAIDFKQIVVHKLNINGSVPSFSNKKVDLSEIKDSDVALDFFVKHIENVRNTSYTRRCQFKDVSKNSIVEDMVSLCGCTNESEEFDEKFLQMSKKQTKRLANYMRSTSSTSDGSLVFIHYLNDGKDNIGILKMDPNDGIEIQDDFSIVVRKDMLPSPKEKLHKSAFIGIMEEYEENELHLYVLDKQQNSQEPSRFFMKKFLNVNELANDANLTTSVQNEMVRLAKKVLKIEQIPNFNQKIGQKLVEVDRFNIDEHLPPILRECLDEDKSDMDLVPAIDDLKREIRKDIPDAVFSFEPVKKKVKDLMFKSAGNRIQIMIDPGLEKGKDYDFRTEEGKFIFTVEEDLDMQQK